MSRSASLAGDTAWTRPGARRRGRLYRLLGGSMSLALGGVLVGLFVLMALLGPYLAPHDPLAMDLSARFQKPSAQHWAGTDQFGRDVFSRILHGAGTSLLAAVTAEAIALAAGTLIGLLSGYVRGRFDLVVQRILEILMAVPGLLLAVVIVAVLGPGLQNVMIAVGLAGIPTYARLVRGQVLAAAEQEYVEAARAMGAGSRRIMLRHIMPNIVAPVLVVGTMGLAGAIQATAALSYLGMGAQPPDPVWGTMVAEAQVFIYNAWWLAAAPGVVIALAVLGFNLFGDGLRDLLDPRTRR